MEPPPPKRTRTADAIEPAVPGSALAGLSNSAAFEELWNASSAVLDPPPSLRSSEFGANMSFNLRSSNPAGAPSEFGDLVNMIQNDLPSLSGMLSEVPAEHAPQPQPIQVPVFEPPVAKAAPPARATPAAASRPTRKAARSYKEEPDEDEEPDSPAAPTSLMLLTDHSGQPTKSRTLAEKMEATRVQLKAIIDTQRALPMPAAIDAVRDLENRHRVVRAQIEEALSDITATFSAEDILDPVEQIRLGIIRLEVVAHFRQIDLLQRELQELQTRSAVDPTHYLASLVIARHPFPKTVFKEKKLSEPVEVRLLTGAKVMVRPKTKVKAFLVSEESSAKGAKKNAITVINDEQDLNDDRVARFQDMQFKTGTGVRKVKLQFEVTVELTYQRDKIPQVISVTMRSDTTEPLIVMTHRSQWEEAEGVLLKHDAFKTSGVQMHMQVPWSVFANALQRHYLRVTSSPRPLSSRDLSNLHQRLGNDTRVSLNDFDNFWKWFGKVSKQIHLQKNLPLWVKGVIFGFVTKKDAQELLKGESDGCCIIRFSDKNPGQFAIAYVKDEGLHHYLMTEDDHKKSLLEFLADHSNIKSVLLCRSEPNGSSRPVSVSKKALIEEFQNPKSKRKKENATNFDGYEPDMS